MKAVALTSARLAAGLCLVAAISTARAQQPQFKTGVERILIDVQVIDAQGRPLENLGPSDFEVRFNREPRAIESVQFVRAAALDTPAGGQSASSGFTAADANGGFGAGGRDFISRRSRSSTSRRAITTSSSRSPSASAFQAPGRASA